MRKCQEFSQPKSVDSLIRKIFAFFGSKYLSFLTMSCGKTLQEDSYERMEYDDTMGVYRLYCQKYEDSMA